MNVGGVWALMSRASGLLTKQLLTRETGPPTAAAATAWPVEQSLQGSEKAARRLFTKTASGEPKAVLEIRGPKPDKVQL